MEIEKIEKTEKIHIQSAAQFFSSVLSKIAFLVNLLSPLIGHVW